MARVEMTRGEDSWFVDVPTDDETEARTSAEAMAAQLSADNGGDEPFVFARVLTVDEQAAHELEKSQ